MKNEKLYDAISDIREDFVEEAENFKFRKRMAPRLVKWGSMAACFCLVLLGASLAMSGLFARKGAMDDYNGSAGPTPTPGGYLQTVLAYNGALYNVSNELSFLNVAGIPDIMTSEDCGYSLGNLKKTENGYEETALDTDIELYQYASAYSNTAVVVIRDGEKYMAGLFSNNMTIGDYNDHSPISSLYRRYGIESEEQLASVVEVNSASKGGAIAEEITSTSVLKNFYEASMTMETECFGREDFQQLVMDKLSEEEYLLFLESERTICVKTAEGLKFYFRWYPEAGWLYSSGATAYYKITGEMQNWLDAYMQ